MKSAVFETVKSLQPYFFSLRELNTLTENPLVSLDIRLPLSWRVDEFLNGITMKVQDQNEHKKLISLVAPNTKEGYDSVFSVANAIIASNKEDEEKIKLFNDKVEELKKIFLESPLDKLKEISFEKPLKKDGIRNKKSTGEIGLGTEEGSSTN